MVATDRVTAGAKVMIGISDAVISFKFTEDKQYLELSFVDKKHGEQLVLVPKENIGCVVYKWVKSE